jgi:hypothetical protein
LIVFLFILIYFDSFYSFYSFYNDNNMLLIIQANIQYIYEDPVDTTLLIFIQFFNVPTDPMFVLF